MTKIMFKVDGAVGTKRRIVVSGGMGGNMMVDAGEKIEWGATEERGSYQVYFWNLDTGDKIWPFPNEVKDGNDAKGDYLEVQRGVKSRSIGSGPLAIKYEVVAVGHGDVGDLDPVLIIRPTLIPRVTLGLICAVVGAIVGALLALRPWQ